MSFGACSISVFKKIFIDWIYNLWGEYKPREKARNSKYWNRERMPEIKIERAKDLFFFSFCVTDWDQNRIYWSESDIEERRIWSSLSEWIDFIN